MSKDEIKVHQERVRTSKHVSCSAAEILMNTERMCGCCRCWSKKDDMYWSGSGKSRRSASKILAYSSSRVEQL
jgi:hypothetical protein